MAQISPALPTIGQPNSSEDPDTITAFTAILGQINGGLDNTNIAAAAGIADTKLASSSNGVWRNIMTLSWTAGGGYAPGQYMFSSGLILSGGIASPAAVHLDPADFAVSGMTPKLRIRSQVVNNTIAPTATYAIAMHGMTLGGSGGNMTVTLGAAISGSTCTHTTPPATSSQVASGAEFAFPTTGAYTLGVAVTGTTAANCWTVGLTFLQVRWI